MSVVANTDYESVLFHGKPSLKMVRELEFLALWLNDKVFNSQSYSDDYLSHIERFTGRKIELVSKDAKTRNWWGELSHLETEKKLNSKETSVAFSRIIGENYSTIIESDADLSKLDPNRHYLFKSFSGVSGKGHKYLYQLKSDDFPLIAEPLHERELDFSAYCFSSGDTIFYQNFIGPQFSYKGSLFDLENAQKLMNLDFVKRMAGLDWNGYLKKCEQIYQIVRETGAGGFSIDSYVFDKSIRSLCEINYRRTMGVTAFEIAKSISKERFQLFVIFKSEVSYQTILEETLNSESVLLSHEKNYFHYLLIPGRSLESIQEKLEKFESVFGTSFSIKIE